MRKKNLGTEVIKVHLPGIQQKDDYSCGPAAIQSIMSYFGVGPIEQAEYRDALKVSLDGTRVEKIIKFAKKHGLRVRKYLDMPLEALKGQLDKRRPVICAIQAWGQGEQDRGHYVVAVGYDDNNFYFHDGSIEGYWGYLTYAEFEMRWHDAYGNKIYNRLGISVWRSGFHHYLQKAVKIELPD